MNVTNFMLFVYLILVFGLVSCSKSEEQTVEEIKHYSVDNLDGIITRSGVEVDEEVSSDGNGSLKITTKGPVVIRLFETGDVDVEDARLTYQAKVRTEGVEGQVFLEMWCQFAGKGEYFSRDLGTPLTGTTEWSTEETPFFLKRGENPDNLKLNLVVNGSGTVWIDDIRLLRGPLN
jgi:hypothetical protein